MLASGDRRGVAQARADALLADMGLEHVRDRPFGALSGGEAQRLMLARALAAQPDLLLVDEPTAQLDHRTAQDVIHALRALADRDVIVAVATHDERVRRVCTAHVDLRPTS